MTVFVYYKCETTTTTTITTVKRQTPKNKTMIDTRSSHRHISHKHTLLNECLRAYVFEGTCSNETKHHSQTERKPTTKGQTVYISNSSKILFYPSFMENIIAIEQQNLSYRALCDLYTFCVANFANHFHKSFIY